MSEQETDERSLFKELVDRSMIIVVEKCDVCGAIVARIDHPLTAKLDSSCDMGDHIINTNHKNYTALKVLVIYMCQADKRLAEEIHKKNIEWWKNYLGDKNP